jgi:hypothetical protein
MMKKFYTLALAALFGSAAMAQVEVTFQVDMSNETVGPNGVFAAGDWQDGLPGEDGPAGDWNAATNQMTDVGNGIYELTATVEPGQYQFKHINSSSWEDGFAGTCQVGGGNGNRFFAVTSYHATDGLNLPAVLFNQCAPQGEVAVRLELDMLDAEGNPLALDPNGVHVAGSLIVPNWTPAFGASYDRGSNRFQYVTTVAPNATYIYKWINGNDFVVNTGVEDVFGTCGDGSGNRVVAVGTENTSTIAFCYNSCDVCVDPIEVTFRVDMSGAGNVAPEGAIIAGTFTNWASGEQPMVDEGNGIWSHTAFLSPGGIQWKFKNGPDGWEDGILGPCQNNGNRTFTVVVSPDPLVVGPFCFQSCDATCDVPDPANITFRVDMSNETIAPDGVFFISSFLGWQSGALVMTDTGNSIYEVTAEYSGPANISYKYVNGSVAVTENEEFHALPGSPGACAISNNSNGWNRVHERSGEPEVLPIVPFGECLPLSAPAQISLGSVSIFPNPSMGSTFVEIENPNGYNLRMSIVDVTGKMVRENIVFNNGLKEINTRNFAPGLYFLNITNEKSERAVYKLMVR